MLRGLGTCALLMLHITLAIGPLARLDKRFLPVLYNRRHLGVATFAVGLLHGLLATGFYHGFGRLNPLVSLFGSNQNVASMTAFPFELLGVSALLLLFLLAATSHDFWQKNLGPSIWKGLHMSVYVAYALLVMHVALGALQSETNPLLALLLFAGVGTICGLQLYTSLREHARDRAIVATMRPPDGDSSPATNDIMNNTSNEIWTDVGSVDEIPDSRAKTVCLPGRERIAIFRHGDKISAVTNVCAHQRGPLGEGKVIDGCITCPWHGWEYRPETGRSPPPFHERIVTYRVCVRGRRILLDPRPLPPGTAVEPASIQELVQHVG